MVYVNDAGFFDEVKFAARAEGECRTGIVRYFMTREAENKQRRFDNHKWCLVYEIWWYELEAMIIQGFQVRNRVDMMSHALFSYWIENNKYMKNANKKK